jgi:hypothetical protein
MNITFERERDSYGRSCHRVSNSPENRTLGYVVRLPKAAIAAHPDRVYLTNDWTIVNDPGKAVRYHRTLAEAKARFTAKEAA